MAIPDTIERKLSDRVWKRSTQSGLEDAFTELGVPISDPFYEFYSKFFGPFRSKKFRFELLDLIDQEESIIVNTRVVREDFGFPSQYVVLTSIAGLSVLIYDIKTGCVFDVDFEGGDKLLIDGNLSSRWQSWWEFTNEYLS